MAYLSTPKRNNALHYDDGLEDGLEGGGCAERRSASLSLRLDKTPTSEQDILVSLGESADQHYEEGRTTTLYCRNSGHKRVLPKRCKGRTCPVCRERDFARLCVQYKTVLQSVNHPKFITISPKNVVNLTQRYVRWFHCAVKKLLRRARWREVIHGGVLFAECTNIGNGWHPHLHGLIDAWFVDKKEFAKEISEELGVPCFVDVQEWDKPENILKYCLGYLKKSPDIYRVDGLSKKQLKLGHSKRYVSSWNAVRERKSKFDSAYRGVRTVIPFGKLYGVKRPEKKPLQCECGCNEWLSEFGLRSMILDEEGHETKLSRKRGAVFHGSLSKPVGRKWRDEILRETEVDDGSE